MAACRVLSQELETKIDIKEQRSRSHLAADFPSPKNWTKFHVKIEAIQCFPCYVKLTLTRSTTTTTSTTTNSSSGPGSSTNPLIVRITIPGLHVQLAASRTKAHCYGLFWKSNRKRCSIFLAFPTDPDRCLHMGWMKESMKELERYRQDFLEIRRASRCSAEITDHQIRLTDVFSNYQNLGPLPPIPAQPTESLEWSRRQSTVSGIYEEIGDPGVRRRERREDPEKDSGIYERLYRRRSNTVTQSLLAQTPPPLPPRERVNTLERTEGTDTDTLKKKKYKTVLETIFGKQSGGRKGSESSAEGPAAAGEVEAIRERFNADLLANLQSNLMKNKRHSMSTPELANWEEGGATRDNLQGMGGEEDEVDLSEWQDVSCMSLLSESMDLSAELNISEQIKPNFNLSTNTSAINLVGCNFNALRESEMGLREEKRLSLNQFNGYCVMKPLKSQTPSEEGVNVLPPEDSGRSSGYCPMGPQGFDRDHVKNLDQLPVRGIVFNEDRVKLMGLKNVTVTRGIGSGAEEVERTEEEIQFEEETSFLRRKPREETPSRQTRPSTTSRDEDLYENCKENRMSRGSKYLVDDKIPSYFPNDSPPHPSTTNQVTPPKLVPKQRSRSSMTPSPRLQHYSPRAVPNIYSVPRNNSPVLMDNAQDTEMLKKSLTSLISNSPLSQASSPGSRAAKRSEEVASCGKGSTPRAVSPEKSKYGTMQSPQKYLEKTCSLKADFVNLKKFASLPRFRKLDLSPLRIKLNNVLHRHNSEF